MMGQVESPSWTFPWRPVHSVTLSPYFMDRFKVTNARYRACVTAGACTEPRDPTATYFDLDRTRYDSFPVVWVNYSDAVAFCAWDGGRLLPTEAQWEKAARGPAPREEAQPWGASSDFCTYVNHRDCGMDTVVSVNEYPLNVSFYYVQGMNANVFEWVRDWYDAGYYAVSPAEDPLGPTSGIYRVFRSQQWFNSLLPYYPTLSRRARIEPDGVTYTLGFRCAREPWAY